jgi:uncharacterized Zn finger protein
MTITLCEKCKAGPEGITGHDDLYTQSFVAGSNVLLQCRACGALWHRAAIKDSAFVWSLSADAHGSMVPQSSKA